MKYVIKRKTTWKAVAWAAVAFLFLLVYVYANDPFNGIYMLLCIILGVLSMDNEIVESK